MRYVHKDFGDSWPLGCDLQLTKLILCNVGEESGCVHVALEYMVHNLPAFMLPSIPGQQDARHAWKWQHPRIMEAWPI